MNKRTKSLTLHYQNTRIDETNTKLILSKPRGDFDSDVASTMRDDRMQIGARALGLRGKCSGA